MCALFLAQPDGREDLSQLWRGGFVDSGEAFCEEKGLGLTRSETQAHWELGGPWAQGRAIGGLKLRSPRWRMWALEICLRRSRWPHSKSKNL